MAKQETLEDDPIDVAVPETPAPAAAHPAADRPRAARTRHYVKIGVLLAFALFAAGLVSVVTIDLGPALRARAERAASAQIERPVHIGRLGTFLLPGRFVVEDLVIEGLNPGDRPFLTCERIVVSTSWPALLRGEILIDAVDMVSWQMVVEQFGDGRHNFPRFTRSPDEASEQPADEASSDADRRRIVTTLGYLRAHEGTFVYEDHGAPWSVVAPNLDVTISKVLEYGGHATFSGGTVQIGSFEPMRADMSTAFTLDGGKVQLTRIDLQTDGASSELTGSVDFGRWPEMFYEIRSEVDFPTMRRIFFADDEFELSGQGDFVGTWHLFKGGRHLEGTFDSEVAGLNDLQFPNLHGALVWDAHRFEVTEATSRFLDGTVDLRFSMAPLGADTPGVASFEARYADVDLEPLFDALEIRPIRALGRATGQTRLDWTIGDFQDRQGGGTVSVAPPAGVRLQARGLPTGEARRSGPDEGWRFPLGGQFSYEFGPEWIDLAPGHLATDRTYIEFAGRTAYGDRSRIPFHVTSGDWRESDRLMAGIMTSLGFPTRVFAVEGFGEIEGLMLGSFGAPRIEGRFAGDGIRGWNVDWGRGEGALVVENAYLDVTEGRFANAEASIAVDGRFSLGYPRKDLGEEINARFRVDGLPAGSLRDAFGIEGYLIDGPLTGEVHLYGPYRRPFGFGRMAVLSPVAYGEPFDSATAGLRFEGNGVRIDALDLRKGAGRLTGAAFVAWDGSYSFNADGRRIDVDTIATIASPRAPLSGRLEFTAAGAGTFDDPRYDVRGSIADLFIRDEGIGQVTGRIEVRSGVMGVELEAASPRLAVSGSGRVALTPEADADLSFRFTNSSLDPYVRTFEPRLSPFTTAVVSGSLRAVGELQNLDRLLVQAKVDELDLSLFDYPVRNDGPIELVLEDAQVRIGRMRLSGEGTALDLTGRVSLDDEQVALKAVGDANLGILQGFFRNIRSSGDAELVAEIRGPVREPVLVGEATVSNGRLRHFSLPHSLEAVNGRIVFEPGGVRFDALAGELGNGRVQFGGRMGLQGFAVTELGVTATGREMHLRYPEGFRSVVDTELALRGTVEDPLLTGTVNVRDAVWVQPLAEGRGLFDLAGRDREPETAPAVAPTVPLRFDLRIVAPSSLRITDNTTRIVSSAELALRGTYDTPLVFGNAEIERGEVFFEGHRYRVTRGTIDFANPVRIEPFFDIEAETDVRVPGQTYRVTFRMTGTLDRLVPELASDPPLPQVDILALLLGDVRDPQEAELRALRTPEAAQQQLVQAGAARLLTSTLSSGVGRVVERSFGVDTFEITPALADPSTQQSAQLNPTARLLIGKRISDRVHLTLSRALTGSERDLIVVLEYDQSDRWSWVLSQNEDQTYALDFRVRHAF